MTVGGHISLHLHVQHQPYVVKSVRKHAGAASRIYARTRTPLLPVPFPGLQSRKLTDGRMATRLAEGIEQQQEQLQSQQQSQLHSVATILSPRNSSCRGENFIDREATRCELERLLTTAGTDDKKKKVKQALDHLEDGSSRRGAALAIIVNDTLVTASAVVAGATSPKRQQSSVGNYNIAAVRQAGSIQLESGAFDRNNPQPWKSTDRNGGIETSMSLEGNLDPKQRRSTVAHQAVTSAGQGVNQTLESSEVQQTVLMARRFTAGSLPSIPEHRVAGRRLAVKQTGGGEDGADGKGGNESMDGGRGTQNGKDVPRGQRNQEEDATFFAKGGRATQGLEAVLAFPRRGGKVVDVPQALLGEATSTGVDPSHPPGAAVDGVLASFWLSTGLFPQTLTIRLRRPVAVYEVMVACEGVDVARVQLGQINCSTRQRFSSSGSGSSGSGRAEGSGGDGQGTRSLRGDRGKESKLLELVREQRRPSVTGGGNDAPSAGDAAGSSSSFHGTGSKSLNSDSSLPFARLVFRVPGGEQKAETVVDQLSLVVTSAHAPFCLVTDVAIRGRFNEEGGEEAEYRYRGCRR